MRQRHDRSALKAAGRVFWIAAPAPACAGVTFLRGDDPSSSSAVAKAQARQELRRGSQGLIGCVWVIINFNGRDCHPFDSLRSLRAGFLRCRPRNDDFPGFSTEQVWAL